MHQWCVIYSSVTGNTRKVAEAIAETAGTKAIPLAQAPTLYAGTDIVAVGYWLWRGGPDPKTAAFLPKLRDTNVVLFETHAAENRSEHAITAFARAAQLLDRSCRILATFECQGQVSEAVAARRAKLPPNDPHAKATGWKTAQGHPNESDLAAVREFAQKADLKLQMLEDAAARQAAKSKPNV